MKWQETWQGLPTKITAKITTLQVKPAMPSVLHLRRALLPVDVALRRGSNPLGRALVHDRRPGVAH